jgi:hypothetical protein
MLIAAEIVLGLLGITADFAGETKLPIEIRNYIARSSEADLTLAQLSGFGVGMVLVIGLIVGWVGLWRLWRPARTIYAVCWLAAVPLYLLLDPVVYYTPLGSMLSEYSVLAAGAILSLVFFSDLAGHFNRTRAEQAASCNHYQPPCFDDLP